MSTTPDARPRGWNVTEQLAAKEPAPMPRPPKAPEIANPAVGAGMLGLTIEQVYDAAGPELRQFVDDVLVGAHWVARQRETRMHGPTGFVPCTPEQHLHYVLEEAHRLKAQRERNERTRRAAAERRRCAITGQVDPTTRPRVLPWQPADATPVAALSDRGWIAVIAAAVSRVPAGDLERAAAMLDGLMPAPPADPPADEPKPRRGLRR